MTHSEPAREAVEALARKMANAKLGEGPSIRCEGPTEFEVEQARAWARRALRVLSASPAAGGLEGWGMDLPLANALREHAVADAINRARYRSSEPGLPERGVDEEDPRSREYAFRLAKAALAALASPAAALVSHKAAIGETQAASCSTDGTEAPAAPSAETQGGDGVREALDEADPSGRIAPQSSETCMPYALTRSSTMLDENTLAIAAASSRAGTFSALTMDEHRDLCRAAITAYLQALSPGSTGEAERCSPISDEPLEALSHARTTAANDDMSKPGTVERERHCQRLAAMQFATAEIVKLRALLSAEGLKLGSRLTADGVEAVVVPVEPNSAQLDRAVAFALNVSLGGDYRWTDYMRDLYGRFLSAAEER